MSYDWIPRDQSWTRNGLYCFVRTFYRSMSMEHIRNLWLISCFVVVVWQIYAYVVDAIGMCHWNVCCKRMSMRYCLGCVLVN